MPYLNPPSIPIEFVPNKAVQFPTGAYTVLQFDGLILADTSAGAWTLQLPSAAQYAGTLAVCIISSTADALTITAASTETINGQSTFVVTQQWQVVLLVSSGTTYWTVVSTPTSAIGPPAVKAVATGNVATRSGTGTFDGVGLNAGDVILLPAQSTTTQNGLWVIQSGAWVRPPNYASGTVIQPGMIVWSMPGGTLNGATLWYLGGNTPVTVDTTATTWTIVNTSPASFVDEVPGNITSTTWTISVAPNPVLSLVLTCSDGTRLMPVTGSGACSAVGASDGSTIKTTTNVPVGSTVMMMTGTVGNLYQTAYVATSVITSGTYTLTFASDSALTVAFDWPAQTQTSDGFQYGTGYQYFLVSNTITTCNALPPDTTLALASYRHL
jgi:hypothetical protein